MLTRLLPILFAGALCAQPVSRDTSQSIDLPPYRQLFFDDAVIESRTGLRRVVHQPHKLPAPVILGDQPWEGWAIYPHGSPCVLWDDDEKIYKIWYQAYSVEPSRKERYVMCYATSKDGLRWEKPKLGIYDFAGSKANNIVIEGKTSWALTNVIKDAHDSDPNRRYKCLSWDQGGIAVAFSADGIHWNQYPDNPVLKGVGDSHNILPWGADFGKYVGYFRPGREAGRSLVSI